MTSISADYDAIIVGARIAGSIVATLLGEAGHRILALDRAKFPSDTLSTHFFRAPALRAFDQIGVFDAVQNTAPRLTVNYNVIDGISFSEPVDRPDDFPFYMSVRRITLDEILVDQVRETSNVELREGAKASELLRKNGRVVGVRWTDSNGGGEANAQAVIGADGVHSFVAKNVDLVTEHEHPVQRLMYYAYFRGVPANEGPAAEFHYEGNTLAYCIPCDGDLTLLAISAPISEFGEFKRDPEGCLLKGLQGMTEIAPRLPNAERDGPVLGSGNIPCYMRIPFGDGWALVGDAGMVMDPWSGQGIDQASTHAVLLAEQLKHFLFKEKDWQTAMQDYHSERNAFSKKAYRQTWRFCADLRPMTRAALAKRGLA